MPRETILEINSVAPWASFWLQSNARVRAQDPSLHSANERVVAWPRVPISWYYYVFERYSISTDVIDVELPRRVSEPTAGDVILHINAWDMNKTAVTLHTTYSNAVSSVNYFEKQLLLFKYVPWAKVLEQCWPRYVSSDNGNSLQRVNGSQVYSFSSLGLVLIKEIHLMAWQCISI